MTSNHLLPSKQRNLPKFMTWYLLSSNTLDSFSSPETHPRIKFQNHCWWLPHQHSQMLQIVNWQFRTAALQYKGLITESEEIKHIYYYKSYQKGYSYHKNSKKLQCQYKPIYISNLFSHYYHPASMDQPSSSSPYPYPFEIHAPNFDPQINDLVQQKNEQERDAGSEAE